MSLQLFLCERCTLKRFKIRFKVALLNKIVLHVYPNAKKLMILHEKVLSENTSTRISLLQSPSSNNLIKNDVEIKLFFLAMTRKVFRYYKVFLVFTTSFSRNYEKSFSLLREKFLVITTFFS